MGNSQDRRQARKPALHFFKSMSGRAIVKETSTADVPLKPANRLRRQSSTTSVTSLGKRGRVDRLLSCMDVHCTEGEIVSYVSAILSQRLRENDLELALQNPSERRESYRLSEPLRVFEGKSTPKISLEKYIERIIHYLSGLAAWEKENGRDPEIRSDLAVRYVVIALIFLDRITTKHSSMLVTSKNIHRLLITGVLLAAKTSDDVQPKQRYFSDLGGIPLNEMNALERVFLGLISYEAFVLPETFEDYYERIMSVGREASTAEDVFVEGVKRKQSKQNLHSPISV